jgi:class 3 adenylate cyclase/tetratricopeptide (TPR) repeat protein
MKVIARCLLLFVSIFIYGQVYGKLDGQPKIDSLLNEIPKHKDDTNKVNVQLAIAFSYLETNQDKGIKYGMDALDLSGKLGWKQGQAKANGIIANIYNNVSTVANSAKAMEYFLNAARLYKDLNDKEMVAGAYYNIALINENNGDYKTAEQYFLDAKQLFAEAGNKKWIAECVLNTGILYYEQSRFPEALDYYVKVIKLYEELGSKSGVAKAYACIGNVYESTKDYQKALQNMVKAVALSKEADNKFGAAGYSGNIGRIYEHEGNLPGALENYFEALKVFEEAGYKEGYEIFACDIGEVYVQQKNYSGAFEYIQKSLKASLEIGDKHIEAMNYCNLGSLYISMVEDHSSAKTIVVAPELTQGKYVGDMTVPVGKTALLNKAIEYLKKCIAISNEIHVPDVLEDCYKNLSLAYQYSGDFKQSLEYYKTYTTVKDSVFSKDNNEKILTIGLKNEYDRKRMTDSIKVADNQKIDALKLHRQRTYTYLGVSGTFLLLCLIVFVTRNNKLLSKEKKRSEDLLLNILPAEVATELKDHGKSAAKYFDSVTVMFTDFANFTKAGERMSPQNLVDELDVCFKAFDEITFKYGIEKIKTIGDSYLAACGLPLADPLHAENIVRAAIEINAFMTDRHAKLGNSTFEARIGIHTGPVVAGIVGVKKFQYDIWGDTVNTANRMESSGEVGKVNISGTTYELVKDKFTFEYRGKVTAKGKGELDMYFVL